jgi:hypothetical protein
MGSDDDATKSRLNKRMDRSKCFTYLILLMLLHRVRTHAQRRNPGS